MSRNFELPKISSTEDFSRYAPLRLDFESQILITSNTTFVVPPGTKAVKFTAVGGGQAGVGTTSGAGAGYFEKTFYGPFTGLTTSFQLTIGAANGGNTILRDSAGTTIATAFGATAIGTGATVGVGGTASGGDINSQGSPGGINLGVGGASGGALGNSVYDATYAGRWIYFRESIVNDNVRNYFVNNIEVTTGSRVKGVGINTGGTVAFSFGSFLSTPQSAAPGVASGLFAEGGAAASPPFGGGNGGAGGFGGTGGSGGFSPTTGGAGGPGGYGGNGGPGGSGPSSGGAGGAGGYGGNGGPGGSSAGTGGPGGYAGSGGNGSVGRGPSLGPFNPSTGYSPTPAIPGGNGGAGGFGGGGGGGATGPHPGTNGGNGGPGGFGGGGGSTAPGTAPGVIGTPGNGGPGAMYIEWTMKEPNKLGA